MKQEFLVMIGMPVWQIVATLLFIVVYFTNVWYALSRSKNVLQRSQELPFYEE